MLTNEEIDTLDIALCNLTKFGSSPQFRELFDQAKEANQLRERLEGLKRTCKNCDGTGKHYKNETACGGCNGVGYFYCDQESC